MANNLKYIEIANEIEKLIKTGQLKHGQKLKTEREFTEQFKVSRQTIRQAFNELIKRKLIINRYHQGHYVTDFGIDRNNEILGVTELFERRGIKVHSKVIKLELDLPSQREIELLNIKDKDEIYRLHRIRYAENEVVLIEESCIVANKVPDLQMFNFNIFSLYDIMFKHYGIVVSMAIDEISANQINGEYAKILLNKKSGPALIVDNLSFDQNGDPIELTKSIYNYKIFTYKVVSNQITDKYKNFSKSKI